MTSDYILEKGSPASQDAERAILGSVFLNPVLCDEAAQHLTPSDFSLGANRRIFSAMREMREHNTYIDEITLAEELDRRKQLDEIGGRSYLADLTNGLVVRASNEHHIKIVRDKAILRAVINAGQGAIAKALTNCEAEEVLGGLEEDLSAIRAGTIIEMDHEFPLMVWNTLDAIERESVSTAELLGLTTTIKTLDAVTTGFRKAEVWTLGAFPGRGKTALAKQIATGNAKQGHPVKFFSIEMDEDQLIRRILATEAGIPNYKLRNPTLLSSAERKRTRDVGSAIAEWPLHLDPTPSLTITELLARARLSIVRDKAELVIVDHIGLIDGPGVDNTRRLENVSKAIRAFAKQTKVPVLQLSHLSNPKDKEINRPPTMLDLKYSGDIAGHSHVVLLLYVPEDERGEPTGEDEIIIGKIREGCKGPLPVLFNTDRLEFEPRGNGGVR